MSLYEFYKEYKVHKLLSPYIDCVWMENYTQLPDVKGKTLRVVPDNTVELIFMENKMARQIGDKDKPDYFASHLSGLKTKPQNICVKGRVILAVRFKPFGLRFFTNVELRDTIDATIEPEFIFGKSIQTLEQKIYNANSAIEQVEFVENYFLDKLIILDKKPDRLFDFVQNQIHLKSGNINLSGLSQQTGYSLKTLERKFISNVGITPLSYSKLIRFTSSINQLTQTSQKQKPDWSSIAYLNGYYDQNHFIKEIKRYTGLTPQKYFSTDRNLQLPVFTNS